MTLTPGESKMLAELRAAAESDCDGWGQVYLDNVLNDYDDRRSACGLLGSLAAKGLYRPQGDDCFGDVKLRD